MDAITAMLTASVALNMAAVVQLQVARVAVRRARRELRVLEKRVDHAQYITSQHRERHVKIERAYNDLKSRAYLRDARGRIARAMEVLR